MNKKIEEIKRKSMQKINTRILNKKVYEENKIILHKAMVDPKDSFTEEIAETYNNTSTIMELLNYKALPKDNTIKQNSFTMIGISALSIGSVINSLQPNRNTTIIAFASFDKILETYKKGDEGIAEDLFRITPISQIVKHYKLDQLYLDYVNNNKAFSLSVEKTFAIRNPITKELDANPENHIPFNIVMLPLITDIPYEGDIQSLFDNNMLHAVINAIYMDGDDLIIPEYPDPQYYENVAIALHKVLFEMDGLKNIIKYFKSVKLVSSNKECLDIYRKYF